MSFRGYRWFLLLLACYLIVIWTGYCIWPKDAEAVSAWIIAWTGLVILWYSWETSLLRRVAKKQLDIQIRQTEIQLRPFIVFRREEDYYVLENIGNQAAINIFLNNIVIDQDHGMEIQFPESIPMIRPNESVKISHVGLINGKEYKNKEFDIFFTAHLDKNYAVYTLNLTIQFSNVEGRSYRLIETFAPGKHMIMGFKKEEVQPNREGCYSI